MIFPIKNLKYLTLLTCFFLLLGCKTKAVIAEAKATKPMAVAKLISNHYEVKKDFETLYILATTKYRDDKQSMTLTADIRIQKDEKILVSLRVFGITVAKALITPTEVKYYEKGGNSYFEGDYSSLSKWLGTDLDFQKVQNMLVGQAMDDLEKGKYETSIENGLYKLSENANTATQKNYFFEAAQFLIKKQEIIQSSKNRKLNVHYPHHRTAASLILPAALLIEAENDNKKTSIDIEYNTIKVNEGVSFPYSVPSGYDRIFID